MADKASPTKEPAEVVAELEESKNTLDSNNETKTPAVQGESQEEAAANGAPEASE